MCNGRSNAFVKGELKSGLIYVNKNKIFGINQIGIENAALSKDENKCFKEANKYIN